VKLRQVRFPLKFKLLALMLVLIAASLVVFVSIALRIFQQDKRAYIYETLLNKASSTQIILSQKLAARMDPTAPAPPAFDLVAGELLFAGRPVSAALEAELAGESIYQLQLIVPLSEAYWQWTSRGPKKLSQAEQQVLEPVLSQSIHQAVKEVQLDGDSWLYAYDYNPQNNFILVASIRHADAYAVTRYLVNKSLYYGLFILGAAMILSVFLARPLTAQLEKLFAVTQDIASGNFNSRARISARDEVGALSDSINDMADKIVIYMQEMKEKARLENEVAVAQLVQSSFFPPHHQKAGRFEFYGHFEPATECGGDWWGLHDQGDWKIFFIADATGHGVPAALLTATMNCCKTSLNFIMESRPELAAQPSEILRYMNQAVCGAGNAIQVTCFVASFNQQTLELRYANASHTPPLLINHVNEVLTKDNLRPLMDANGPRLGQSITSSFQQQAVKLQGHDTIFFYTDGLIEAENAEGNRWGERRMLKSLIEFAPYPPGEIIQGLMKNFNEHISQQAKNDDLTLVAMKVNP
jgi:phosphoserine phosphatase RsbU/P